MCLNLKLSLGHWIDLISSILLTLQRFLSSVSYVLTSLLSSTSSLEAVPKTFTFCLSKDMLYQVYSHLVRSCSPVMGQAIGQHPANMTEEAHSWHYELYETGLECIIFPHI